jgi:hypothetical protein
MGTTQLGKRGTPEPGDRIRFWVRVMWAVIGVHIAGRALDLWWHATHTEFETATDQLQAHWLVWLSVLAAIIVSALAMRETPLKSPFLALLLANAFYVPVAVWHFWEHYHLRDPDTPHVLLVLAELLVFGSAIWVGVQARRVQQAGSRGSEGRPA